MAKYRPCYRSRRFESVPCRAVQSLINRLVARREGFNPPFNRAARRTDAQVKRWNSQVISVDIAGHRFQLRAAAVISHEGFVLLHRLEGDDYWALPGGRIEPGEDARSTLKREMLEEINEPVECDKLLYVVENFFEHAGKPNHEIGLYFQVLLKPESTLFDKSRSHTGIEGSKQLEFRWFDAKRVAEVDVRPSFLRESLSQPSLHLQHFVQRG